MRDDETEKIALARVGTVINGKWTVERLIGVGGMASVYAATHRNSKRAALKIMHPELSAQAAIRERFLREGYLSNLVDHPGVVTVDDDDTTEDGCAFLVMELVEGETLEARLRRKGPLPAEEVLTFMDQVLHALATAHTRGVVHRDLKPENILLSTNGEVKLLDFGIARARALSTDPTKTLTEGLMGTPAFMPPEQARGRWEEVDAQSDVWALGATMFTLLTGRNVHQAGTTNEALAVAMTRQAPRLEEYRPDLPPAVLDLVNKALCFEKKDRWPNATVMLLAVRKATTRVEEEALEAEAADAARQVHADSQPELYFSEEEGSNEETAHHYPTADPVHESGAEEYEHEHASSPHDDRPTNPISSELPFPPDAAVRASRNPLGTHSHSTPLPDSIGPAGSKGSVEEAQPVDPSGPAVMVQPSDDQQPDRHDSTANDAVPSGALASVAPAAVWEPEKDSHAASAAGGGYPSLEEVSAPPGRDQNSAGEPDHHSAESAAGSALLNGAQAAERSVTHEASAELPARKVVAFSDVPATSALVARATETTTARSALSAGARAPSRNRWSLVAGGIGLLVLLLLVAKLLSGGHEPDVADAGSTDASHATPARREAVVRGKDGLAAEPEAADAAAARATAPTPSSAAPEDPGVGAEDSVALEALPLVSSEPSAKPAARQYWHPKAGVKKTDSNIFNKAKNLAVKRATVRSERTKSGKLE